MTMFTISPEVDYKFTACRYTDSVNVYHLTTVSFEQLAFPFFQQFKNLNKKQFNLKIHIKKFKKYVMCISYLILSTVLSICS